MSYDSQIQNIMEEWAIETGRSVVDPDAASK